MNAVLGDLPTWNLSDLYSSPTGTDLDADLKRADRDADSFAKDFEGKVAGLDGKTLGGAVARFEALSDLMGRIGSYAQLYYAQDQADPKRGQFAQNASEKLTDIGSKLLFFQLELNKIEDADLAAAHALCREDFLFRTARFFRQEHGKSAIAGTVLIGTDHKRHHVGARRMGDPRLVAIDLVDIAVFHGTGLESRNVRSA